MFRISLLISLLACYGPALAGPPDTGTITLRGETLPIWPHDNLIARGFEVPEVPPEQNAAWLYLDAINAFEDLPGELAEDVDKVLKEGWSDAYTELGEYLDKSANRESLALAAQAATKPRYLMPYFGDSTKSVIAILLPNLSHHRFLSKLVVLDAARLESRGKYKKAADGYVISMRMGHHVSQGITLIEGLVGLAQWQMGLEGLISLVLDNDLSQAQLKDIIRTLNNIEKTRATILPGLRNETRFGPAIIDEICARPFRIHSHLPDISDLSDVDFDPIPKDGWGKLELRVGQLLLPDRTIHKHMDQYYRRILKRAEAEPFEAKQMEFNETKYLSQDIPRWDIISKMVLPALSRSVQLDHRNIAKFQIARVATALRLYMKQHDGEIPDSLDRVADLLPEGALIDPYSASLLKYRKKEAGWLVYSVGENGVDDGGVKRELRNPLDIPISYPRMDIE